MCGIAGILAFDEKKTARLRTVENMSAALEHRGPDGSGIWHDHDQGIYLAHRRLAIIDLSPTGHQPMSSHSGRYVLTYNGEVYNFAEIAAELKSQTQVSFLGTSDTEVMLAAIEHWGLDKALGKFVGMFALALWDRQDHELTLIRDRLGVKPLYYGFCGHELAFASDLKAFAAIPGFERRIKPASVAAFFTYNYVPTPHSIFENIFKLPQGSSIKFSRHESFTVNREAKPQVYWSLTAVANAARQAPLTEPLHAIEQVERALRKAVTRRLVADVPLGAFLSGGIDSALVVALMQQSMSTPARTFTLGFEGTAFDEAPTARRVAKHLGTDHTELLVSAKEMLDLIPRMPEIYSEPFADSSQVPTYLVSKLARAHVTVALSGDGGDEVFGGYNRYVFADALWRKLRDKPLWLRRHAASALSMIRPGVFEKLYTHMRKSLPKRWQGTHIAAAYKFQKVLKILAAENPRDVYRRLISFWQPSDRLFASNLVPVEPSFGFAQALADGSFNEHMMLWDALGYMSDDILTKVDRASMAVGLEAREPLLDHQLIELAWHLPETFKIHHGKTKWILRKVLAKYVPPEMNDNPKSGFGMPIDHWLRGPLKEWGADLLHSQMLKDSEFIDIAVVKRKWDEHQSGKANWYEHLWSVMMFLGWHQRYADGSDI